MGVDFFKSLGEVTTPIRPLEGMIEAIAAAEVAPVHAAAPAEPAGAGNHQHVLLASDFIGRVFQLEEAGKIYKVTVTSYLRRKKTFEA